jgi:hypothetical protein
MATPVSTTPPENFANGATGVVDTVGKFGTGVHDTDGKCQFTSVTNNWNKNQTAYTLK